MGISRFHAARDEEPLIVRWAAPQPNRPVTKRLQNEADDLGRFNSRAEQCSGSVAAALAQTVCDQKKRSDPDLQSRFDRSLNQTTRSDSRKRSNSHYGYAHAGRHVFVASCPGRRTGLLAGDSSNWTRSGRRWFHNENGENFEALLPAAARRYRVSPLRSTAMVPRQIPYTTKLNPKPSSNEFRRPNFLACDASERSFPSPRSQDPCESWVVCLAQWITRRTTKERGQPARSDSSMGRTPGVRVPARGWPHRCERSVGSRDRLVSRPQSS